jgi:hypothetical protein
MLTVHAAFQAHESPGLFIQSGGNRLGAFAVQAVDF